MPHIPGIPSKERRLVSAVRARAHLDYLSRMGVGRRAVSDASDVDEKTLFEIRHGLKRRIMSRTERRILAVTAECKADHALVPATDLWRQLSELLAEGYSKDFIARAIGSARLQFGKERVFVRSAHRVAVLHRRLMS